MRLHRHTTARDLAGWDGDYVCGTRADGKPGYGAPIRELEVGDLLWWFGLPDVYFGRIGCGDQKIALGTQGGDLRGSRQREAVTRDSVGAVDNAQIASRRNGDRT